jgi:hypothetical protein
MRGPSTAPDEEVFLIVLNEGGVGGWRESDGKLKKGRKRGHGRAEKGRGKCGGGK